MLPSKLKGGKYVMKYTKHQCLHPIPDFNFAKNTYIFISFKNTPVVAKETEIYTEKVCPQQLLTCCRVSLFSTQKEYVQQPFLSLSSLVCLKQGQCTINMNLGRRDALYQVIFLGLLSQCFFYSQCSLRPKAIRKFSKDVFYHLSQYSTV